MPGYIIHLSEGNLILKRLSAITSDTSNNFAFLKNELSADWMNDFKNGLILPDCVKKEDKTVSHFRDSLDTNKKFSYPNLTSFFKKYQSKLNEPLLLGYHAHIHLDYLFFHDYLPSIISFEEADQTQDTFRSKLYSVRLGGSDDVISKKEFFSQEYLYGDYTKLNIRLIKRYNLPLGDYAGKTCQENEIKRYKEIIPEIQSGDINSVYRKLSGYLKESNDIDSNNQLKVFSEEDLCKFLEDAAEQFITMLVKTQASLH